MSLGDVSFAHQKKRFDKKKLINNHFWGLYIMSIALQFKLQ